MKISKAILTSVCILPVVTTAYAGDTHPQAKQMTQAAEMSVNEPALQNQKAPMAEVPAPAKSMTTSKTEVDVKPAAKWRWPWQKKEKNTDRTKF